MWLPMAAVAGTSIGAGLVAESAGLDPSALAQYGVAGVIAALALIIIRYLYNKQTAGWDRERGQLLEQANEERARGDRLEGELSRLNTMVQTQVLTALNEATRAVIDAIAAVRQR